VIAENSVGGWGKLNEDICETIAWEIKCVTSQNAEGPAINSDYHVLGRDIPQVRNCKARLGGRASQQRSEIDACGLNVQSRWIHSDAS